MLAWGYFWDKCTISTIIISAVGVIQEVRIHSKKNQFFLFVLLFLLPFFIVLFNSFCIDFISKMYVFFAKFKHSVFILESFSCRFLYIFFCFHFKFVCIFLSISIVGIKWIWITEDENGIWESVCEPLFFSNFFCCSVLVYISFQVSITPNQFFLCLN